MNGPGARDLAHGLDPKSKRIYAFAPYAALNRYLGRAAEHTRAFERALTYARDLAQARDPAYVRDLDYALDRARNLGNVLDSGHIPLGLRHEVDLNIVLSRVRILERSLNSTRVLAPDLGPDLDLDLGRAIASVAALARDLERDLNSVRVAARDVIAAGEEALRHEEQVGQTQTGSDADPARSAVRITRVASGLLPRRDRARYTEEYRAELADLAAAGYGRWRQLGHAGRLLGRTGALRLALAWAHQRRRKAA